MAWVYLVLAGILEVGWAEPLTSNTPKAGLNFIPVFSA